MYEIGGQVEVSFRVASADLGVLAAVARIRPASATTSLREPARAVFTAPALACHGDAATNDRAASAKTRHPNFRSEFLAGAAQR
jgi:hypothetical protein